MSVTSHPSSPAIGPRPRLWNRDEYYRMAETGILRPDERVELIGGEVIRKVSPMGTPHATAIAKIAAVLEDAVGEGASIRQQLPLSIADTSEPDPDVLVVRGGPDDYDRRHPGPEDVLLLVEVADSSLTFDSSIKGILYAAAGIPEYWIVNLASRSLEVRRKPVAQACREITVHDETQSLSPLSAPLAFVTVSDLLPHVRSNSKERETE